MGSVERSGGLVVGPETRTTSTAPASASESADDLTFQQRRFIDELLADPEMNQTNAARKAYPNASEPSLRSMASENLAKPNIRSEIERRMKPAMVKARMTKDRVLQLIGDGMNWDIAEAFNGDGSLKAIHEMPPAVRRQIGGIEVEEIRLSKDGPVVGHIKKVKLVDRTRHIELAARHHKLLTDKVEHSFSDGLADKLTKARKRASA